MFIQGPINEKSLAELQWAEEDTTGAIASFTGVVRADIIEDQKVECIEFTSQTTIAREVMMEIANEAKEKYGITQVVIMHSLGKVNVGEICFVVIVKGGHRKECFAALPFVVDEVKRRCPIFGKEFLSGGVHKWKENK